MACSLFPRANPLALGLCPERKCRGKVAGKRKGAIARPLSSVTKRPAVERSSVLPVEADPQQVSLGWPVTRVALRRQAGPDGNAVLASNQSLRPCRERRIVSELCRSSSVVCFCVARQAVACRAAQIRWLNRFGNHVVTPHAISVNHTDHNFRCGNFGNVEIFRCTVWDAREHYSVSILCRLGIEAIQRRGERCHKKKRGDCSPLILSRERNGYQAFFRFRSKLATGALQSSSEVASLDPVSSIAA
jgi:hypothetical protein